MNSNCFGEVLTVAASFIGEADLGKNPDIDFDIYSRFKEIARLAVQMIIKYG